MADTTHKNEFLASVMAQRAAFGLKLTWFIPAEKREFTAYARDEDQKRAWLIRAKRDGWDMVSN